MLSPFQVLTDSVIAKIVHIVALLMVIMLVLLGVKYGYAVYVMK